MSPKIAVTREQIRELDRIAIEEFGIPGVVLMENAGKAVVDEVAKQLPNDGVVAILCGRGNNGGDGFVVARHLHNREVEVHTSLACPLEKARLGGDASTNLEILLKMGLTISQVLTPEGVESLVRSLGSVDVIVDALLGTGLAGEVRQPMRQLIDEVNGLGVPVIAVDIPSGLDCDEGTVLGSAIKATKTVTFALPKVGFLRRPAREHLGELIVADISIPQKAVERLLG